MMIKVDLKIEDINECSCRVCLENVSEGVSILSKCEDDKGYIYEKINNIACVEIVPGNNLPQQICTKCLQALNTAYEFKQTCQRSEGLLHSSAFTHRLQHDKPTVKEESSDATNCKSDNDEESYTHEVPLFEEYKPDIAEEKPQFVSKSIDLKLECHDCGGSFKSKCKLRVHWKKVHLKEQLICVDCKQTFGSFKTFNNHRKRKGVRCFNGEDVRVEGVGTSRVFHCKACPYSTKRVQTMVYHLRVHNGEKPFKCDLCSKCFSQLSSLQVHSENVHKKYTYQVTCHICGLFVQGRDKCFKHMRRHQNLCYPCTVCGRKLKSRRYLLNHMQLHSNVKSFTCEICASSFVSEAGLYHHKRRKHTDLAHKTWTCDKCGYVTKHKRIIKAHESKHSNNNIACNICGMFFHSIEKLNKHKNSHLKKVQCSECNKGFSAKRYLIRHLKKIHHVSVSALLKPKQIVNSEIECPVKDEPN